jgi:hypothetical protein
MKTWDLLPALGFVDDPAAITETPPGLTYRSGGLVVTATRGKNQWLRDSIFLMGHHATQRSLEYIQSEIPLEVASEEELRRFLRAVVSAAGGHPWSA